jgi:hypothetical protein
MRVNREGFIPVANARLWSPDDPFLYDLKAELVRVNNPFPADWNRRVPQLGDKERELYAKAEVEGVALGLVTSYFGMRKVASGPGKGVGSARDSAEWQASLPAWSVGSRVVAGRAAHTAL